MNQVEYFTRRFLHFDIHTDYSDDHSVWKRGQEARSEFSREVKQADLTLEEKLEIYKRVGEQHDKIYLDAVAKYGKTIAPQPLWGDEKVNDLRYFVMSYLELGKNDV